MARGPSNDSLSSPYRVTVSHGQLDAALLASPAPDTSSAELRRRLREAQWALREKDEALEKKDNDLVIAAELGSSLLEDNERLKAECAKLLAEYRSTSAVAVAIAAHPPTAFSPTSLHKPSTPGSASSTPISASPGTNLLEEAKRRTIAIEAAASARIGDLEATILDLQSHVDRLRADIRASQDAERAQERRSQRLESENEVISRDLDAAVSKCQELEEERKKIAKEKAELLRRVKDVGERDKELEELAELRDRSKALEEVVVQLTHSRAEMEAELAEALQDRRHVDQRCEELEAVAEDYRMESERQAARMDELVWELESSRDLIAKLHSRLAVLEPARDGPEDAGDRTLFSEVEDRRRELENRHQNLTQKHAGLLKAHSVTIHQQERMRNHISRLTQLTSARQGELRIRLLEEALGQAESEKREMQAKLALLEKGRGIETDLIGVEGSNGPDMGTVSPSQYEVQLECLRLRVSQLTEENDDLKREARTGRMLKSFETEKLRSVEAVLREREEELLRLKSINAQIKFDLDEMKSRFKRARGLDAEGSDKAATDGKAVGANTSPTSKSTGVQTQCLVEKSLHDKESPPREDPRKSRDVVSEPLNATHGNNTSSSNQENSGPLPTGQSLHDKPCSSASSEVDPDASICSNASTISKASQRSYLATGRGKLPLQETQPVGKIITSNNLNEIPPSASPGDLSSKSTGILSKRDGPGGQKAGPTQVYVGRENVRSDVNQCNQQ
ncbi:uncharacterized protein SPPG_00843 [Spizellomyces punctatus DAOM BR117]|uniref:Uncharacterized protein n=1 Tax=Spizellomyces punctatus (strain DAOM BR117) TaxID=645134 RepID=A0A0L0HV06_SPIPD|nr:uncharacterized protein SPPG_00843 [Spizellomyces punctatus DAOM BR117]KND05176.1 hypothetical protein SPPG_00843 [Spizellomyces punctatus DAOM BR117]|eukprot:XP_016613215.1 hypothetical protein SPPG_00843 [Spizellomyces punctatus DAOM BR117]